MHVCYVSPKVIYTTMQIGIPLSLRHYDRLHLSEVHFDECHWLVAHAGGDAMPGQHHGAKESLHLPWAADLAFVVANSPSFYGRLLNGKLPDPYVLILDGQSSYSLSGSA